jgi:hypothetical protein
VRRPIRPCSCRAGLGKTRLSNRVAPTLWVLLDCKPSRCGAGPPASTCSRSPLSRHSRRGFFGAFRRADGLRPQYALPRRHKGDAGSRERCAHRTGDTISDTRRSTLDHAAHHPGSSVRLRVAAIAAYAGFGRECIVPFQPCRESDSRIAPNQAKGRLWCRWSETRVFDLTSTEHANWVTQHSASILRGASRLQGKHPNIKRRWTVGHSTLPARLHQLRGSFCCP